MNAYSPQDFLIALGRQVDPVEAFRTAVGFPPDDWQTELLTIPLTVPLVQVLASRGTGKSQCSAVLAFSFADSNPGVTVLILAPSLRQANELFRYINLVRDSLPLAHPAIKDTQSEVHLSNGSRIVVLPGTADNIRGFRCHLLILEEASRLSDDLFTAVVPSVLGTGRIIAITTPAGRKGWFYDLWVEGKAYRITARSIDLPRLAETVARDKLIMRAAQFRTEHLLEFAGSGGDNVFDFETVNRAFCNKPALELSLWSS